MKTNNFKPNCHYGFTESDLKFAIQLAKVGEVHLLSNQIRLTSCQKGGLNFLCSVQNAEKSCHGMTLPEGWVIESIYTNENGLSTVLFGINHSD